MKTFLNHSWRIIVSTISLYIIWILSMSVAGSIIPSGLQTVEGQETLSAVLLLVVCLIHVGVLYIMICNLNWRGIKLMLVVFATLYFIQFVLSMIETIWFNASLEMPASGIKNILLSGFIMSLVFSPLFVTLSGKLRPESHIDVPKIDWKAIFSGTFLVKVLILIVIVYPMLYNLAGYYIAWQFEEVRLFYTGSSEIDPFGSMFLTNIKSGLYAFQIFRALMWVLLALPVYYIGKGGYVKKGVIIGLLFAALMNAQHMLPNPYFPAEVSFAHFIETFLSNFLWGYSIAWILNWKRDRKLTTD